MPTFQELHENIRSLQFQKLVFDHIIDYIERNFRPVSGKTDALKMLIDSDRVPVPDAVFEQIVAMMAQQSSYLGTQIVGIQASPVTLGPVPTVTTNSTNTQVEPPVVQDVTKEEPQGESK
jgi:hypothetical protein